MDRIEEIREMLADDWFVYNPNGSDVNEEIQFLLDEVAKLRRSLEVAVGALKDLAAPCTRADYNAAKLDGIVMGLANEALAQIEAIGGGDGLREGAPKV